MTLLRIDVVRQKGVWGFEFLGRRGFFPASRNTQAQAFNEARLRAGMQIADGARGVTVRIHRANGRIREERTYPRSADPRRSRG